MSSFEANAYSAKPSVQVANAITVTKPIVANNVLHKSSQEINLQNQQRKPIQPLLKPVIEHHTSSVVKKETTPTLLQLKNLHKPAPASVNADINPLAPLEVTRKQVTKASLATIKKGQLESKKPELYSRSPVASVQKRILSASSKSEVMGNEPPRMSAPTHPQVNAVGGAANVHHGSTAAVIPGSLAVITQASSTSNASVPQMASIIKASGDGRVIGGSEPRAAAINPSNSSSIASISQSIPSISTVPRVVSTSSTKTITGGSNSSLPQSAASMRGGKTLHGQHTHVIQSAPAIRAQTQGAIVRPNTPPTRSVTTHHPRPFNQPMNSSQNPTTVQITIHQPAKAGNVTGSGSGERIIHSAHPGVPLSAANHHSAAGSFSSNSSAVMNESLSTTQSSQVLQKLVISQSPSGIIQSKTTIPVPNQDPTGNRYITTTTLSHSIRKPVRPIINSSTGQHDYVRADPLPIPNVTTLPTRKSDSRSAISLHTIPDKLGNNFHPTSTIPSSTSLYHTNTGPYQATGQAFKPTQFPLVSATTTMSHSSSSVSAGLSSTPIKQTVISNIDNSSQDSNTSSLGPAAGSPRPSILRKRTHDHSSNTVVVKKLLQPSDRLVSASSAHNSNSQPASPARAAIPISVSALEKDNASQSSTDTAISSESSPHNRHTFKQEAHDIAEINNSEPQPPDVSPRKKPRKQLLNTAAELKDRHDSSTEEETETKNTHMLQNVKMETDEQEIMLKTSPIKEDFVDREGVRWVKMRQRQADPLMCYYNCSWKSRNNHFHRRSDIKIKEERRPVVSELTNQKGVVQKASGWKFYHISAQFQDMISSEESLIDRLSRLQDILPRSKQNQPELSKIYELAQANKQRCSLTKDQLQEAKSSMFSILDTHKSSIMEIIQKHHSKRPVKKKERL